MTVWHTPNEVQRDIQLFAKFLLFWLGLYVWEFLNSLEPDLDILLARRPFRPAQLVYFACRYGNLAFLIGTNIAMEVSHPVNCHALYVFDVLALGIVLGTSSGLLMLRTAVVWSYDKRIVIPLIIFSLGHWAIIIRDIFVVQASWNPPAHTCAVDQVFNYWLAVEFIYTMVLDFIILCLTTIGLFRCLPIKSKVRDVLLRDGIIYFICAFTANLVPCIVMLMHLNPIMDFLFVPLGSTVSSIVATRTVRRLTLAFQADSCSRPLETNPERPKDSRSSFSLSTPYMSARGAAEPKSVRFPITTPLTSRQKGKGGSISYTQTSSSGSMTMSKISAVDVEKNVKVDETIEPESESMRDPPLHVYVSTTQVTDADVEQQATPAVTSPRVV